jgi:anti-sigma B factor antagonist
MIKAETLRDEQYALVKIFNENLDAGNAGDFKIMLDSLIQEGEKNLIIDLEAVRFCDSSGLDAILEVNRQATERKGSFVLCRLNQALSDMMENSQQDDLLSIVPTPEEAVDLVLFNEIENQLRAESGEG